MNELIEKDNERLRAWIAKVGSQAAYLWANVDVGMLTISDVSQGFARIEEMCKDALDGEVP